MVHIKITLVLQHFRALSHLRIHVMLHFTGPFQNVNNMALNLEMVWKNYYGLVTQWAAFLHDAGKCFTLFISSVLQITPCDVTANALTKSKVPGQKY